MNSQSFVDLTHTFEPGMQAYPGNPAFACNSIASLKQHGANLLAISMTTHTGTHVDAPFHFFEDGKTIDQIPLSTFIGPALVIDLTRKGSRETIVWADLAPFQGQMGAGVILLLHTGWSDHWCTPKYNDHPILDRDAAERIVATGVRVIGVDTLSPDETLADGSVGEGGFGAHEAILGVGGIIAENLRNLKALEGGGFVVSFVPLNINGSDGSPVRAFAWKKGFEYE